MSKLTHVISDLHLANNQPHLYSLFEYYMAEIAPEADQLFVLGDLFDVWLGDDCLAVNSAETEIYQNTVSLLKKYSNKNKSVYFIHGNRDFLLGEKFEHLTGGKILNEPYITALNGLNVALMHGDSLCTDDVAYQEFRKIVRDKQWQKELLSLPMQKRILIAEDVKNQSKEAQLDKSTEIMDVNHQSVRTFFEQNSVDYLIHGHTHRQATHSLDIGGKEVKRIVLSDWEDKGFYLSIANGLIDEHYFKLNL